MNPEGGVSIFREESGRTNGNAFDAQGRLISCEGYGLGPTTTGGPFTRREGY